jgi:hypothetical protein
MAGVDRGPAAAMLEKASLLPQTNRATAGVSTGPNRGSSELSCLAFF